MSTPHNTAKMGDIAKVCLMPGDPLRAKMIAETFLENPVCFNTVRGMLGYTGTFNGKEVSVMGHGMGIASIGIYSYELFAFYGVEAIIRVGSMGAFPGKNALELGDVVLAQGACTDANFGSQYKLSGTFAPIASFELLLDAYNVAKDKGIEVHVGNIVSSDVFYNADPDSNEGWTKMGVYGIEMECSALYMNAAYLGKKALGMLTVSDILGDETKNMTPEERQTKLLDMIKIALDVATK